VPPDLRAFGSFMDWAHDPPQVIRCWPSSSSVVSAARELESAESVPHRLSCRVRMLTGCGMHMSTHSTIERETGICPETAMY